MPETVANAAAQATTVETQEGSLLDQIVEQGRFGEAKERGKDLRKRDFNAEERRGTRRKVEKGATKERTNRER